MFDILRTFHRIVITNTHAKIFTIDVHTLVLFHHLFCRFQRIIWQQLGPHGNLECFWKVRQGRRIVDRSPDFVGPQWHIKCHHKSVLAISFPLEVARMFAPPFDPCRIDVLEHHIKVQSFCACCD